MDPRGPAADDLRQTADRARDALSELRANLSSAETTRRGEVTNIGARATQLVEELAAKIADELAADIARQHELATIALRADLDGERDALATEREKLTADRQAWETERTEWESVRKEIEAELSAMERRLVQQAQSLQREREAGPSSGELLTQIQEANDARVAAEQERDAVEQKLADVEKDRAITEQELLDMQSQIAQLSETLEESTRALTATAELGNELDTMREKFEMALADLQSHRERVAELEQEIANRPALELDDSAEIEQLRHERDDLARRLEEANEFADPSQEMEDLRARFQMAVEDLRALKTENADLRDQLASGGGAVVSDNGGNDWESQKRRLLAALEGEGEGQIDSPRREERAAIQGTIQITDSVVAEKDAEIRRLKQQLADADADDIQPVSAVEAAVLDNDEVIRVERERIAKLEEEWREKIRTAELEMSVERAKIARAQSELAEQQMELETLRAASGNGLAPGEARRNWFNKLGLGNDGKPS
jgi:chromosome segregation ATPase